MNLLPIFAFFFGLAYSCDAANILVLSLMPTRSHYNIFDKVSVELANRGHRVTLISPFKQSKPVPNLSEVVLDNIYDQMMGTLREEGKSNFNVDLNPWRTLFLMTNLGLFSCEKVLEMTSMKNFLKADLKFDLLISESFLVESVTAGLSVKHKVPTVIIAPFTANYWANYLVGNPAPAAFIPDPFLGFSDKMTFFERVQNTVYGFLQDLNYNLIYLPKQEALMRKHFGSQLPPLKETLKNTSLVLVNHHHSLAFSKPYVPNMIEIGGYHVPPTKPLPQELKTFMDNSKHGVILFSLGSHLKSKDMSKQTIDNILAAFSRLKQDILWKFEDDSLKNLPKNVKIMKWLPQTDLLAHPNMKLFITHGGLLSTIEAITFGVPLVGIPILGDQHVNMMHATNTGFALTVKLEELTENSLYDAVQEVVTNPKYSDCARRRSKLLLDRPMKPMESAIYWIEYVIRHKGASHMRSAAQDLQWYELYMLDVLSVLFAGAFVIVYISFFITRFIWKAIFSRTPAEKNKAGKSSAKKTN